MRTQLIVREDKSAYRRTVGFVHPPRMTLRVGQEYDGFELADDIDFTQLRFAPYLHLPGRDDDTWELEQDWGNFSPDRYGWVTRDCWPCYVPARGFQGLWDVEMDENFQCPPAKPKITEGPQPGLL